MKPVRDVLQDLTMDLRIGFGSYFHICYKAVEVISTRKKVLFVFGKKRIVDVFVNPEIIEKANLLFPRRIQPVFEHMVNKHMIIREYPIYISDAGGCPVSSAIPIYGTRQFISHLSEGEEGVFLP